MGGRRRWDRGGCSTFFREGSRVSFGKESKSRKRTLSADSAPTAFKDIGFLGFCLAPDPF